MLQRGRDGRGGLIDASRDPTLDLYGWDQVADQIQKLRIGRQAGNVPLHPILVSERPARTCLGGKHPVLCYNADDPRGFAFWSKPDDWVGHDGILVVVGEHEAMARYYRRWFSRVETVSDFWVERRASPCGGSASTAAFASASRTRSPAKAKPAWHEPPRNRVAGTLRVPSAAHRPEAL